MVREKEAKISALVYVVTAFVLCFIKLPLVEVGIHKGCSFCSRLLYPFVHANIFHCLVNCWCLLSLVFILDVSILELAISYVIAVLAPVGFWGQVTPTVGLSGLLYCLVGIYTFKVRKKIKWLLWWSFFLGIGFFFAASANLLHLWCFACGLIIGFLNSPAR